MVIIPDIKSLACCAGGYVGEILYHILLAIKTLSQLNIGTAMFLF
jgi:hypothetical protein